MSTSFIWRICSPCLLNLFILEPQIHLCGCTIAEHNRSPSLTEIWNWSFLECVPSCCDGRAYNQEPIFSSVVFLSKHIFSADSVNRNSFSGFTIRIRIPWEIMLNFWCRFYFISIESVPRTDISHFLKLSFNPISFAFRITVVRAYHHSIFRCHNYSIVVKVP